MPPATPEPHAAVGPPSSEQVKVAARDEVYEKLAFVEATVPRRSTRDRDGVSPLAGRALTGEHDRDGRESEGEGDSTVARHEVLLCSPKRLCRLYQWLLRGGRPSEGEQLRVVPERMHSPRAGTLEDSVQLDVGRLLVGGPETKKEGLHRHQASARFTRPMIRAGA